MSQSIAHLADAAIAMLAPVVLATISALLSAAFAFLLKKVKNQHIASVLANVDDLALTVVRSTYMAYVKPLQDAEKWTPEAHAEAKARAVAELKSYLGNKGLTEVEKLVNGNVGKFLEAIIDEAVHNNKLMGAAAKAADPLAKSAQG